MRGNRSQGRGDEVKLTKAQAKKSCLKDWNVRRKDGVPKTKGCAYCKKYICEKCPLTKLWGTNCSGESTPFIKWSTAKTKNAKMKWADVVYQDIKRS